MTNTHTHMKPCAVKECGQQEVSAIKGAIDVVGVVVAPLSEYPLASDHSLMRACVCATFHLHHATGAQPKCA